MTPTYLGVTRIPMVIVNVKRRIPHGVITAVVIIIQERLLINIHVQNQQNMNVQRDIMEPVVHVPRVMNHLPKRAV